MISLLAGWLVWSLGHYWGHRWLHTRMLDAEPRGAAVGEHLHHAVYDAVVVDPRRDPGRRAASFPYFAMLLMSVAVAAVIAWIQTAPAAMLFLGGYLGSMAVDDAVHFLAHGKGGGRLARLLRLRHRWHHRTHRHNFAFFTGCAWDWVFRTDAQRPRLLMGGPDAGLTCFLAGMADGRALLALLPPVRCRVASLGVEAEDMFHQPGDPFANIQRLCRPGVAAASDGRVRLRPFEVRRVRLTISPLEALPTN